MGGGRPLRGIRATCQKSAFLTEQRLSESPGGLVTTQLLGPAQSSRPGVGSDIGISRKSPGKAGTPGVWTTL